MRRFLAGGILAATLAVGSALAQVGAPGSPAGGRTGYIPPVTDAAPQSGAAGSTGAIAPTGKVKPPGSPLGQEDGKAAALDRRQRELDRRIRTGICRGC